MSGGSAGMFGTLVPNPPGQGGTPIAPHSCATCKTQKRKCDKVLPACGLCARMRRPCDYASVTNATAIPQQISALRQDVSSLQNQVAYRSQEVAPPNAFPSIFSLDNLRFQDDGIQVPKVALQLPEDIYRTIGNGSNMQAILADFIANIHQIFPIIDKHRLQGFGPNELWSGGPEMFCLCFSMMVLASKPTPGLLPAQNELYLACKRLLSFIEASGTMSLMVLQANILVNLYEFGHAIYPAAMMTAAWSVQYSSLLGINGGDPSQMIGPAISPFDVEERRRTFWGVMVMDRIVAAACNRTLLTYHQFPQGFPTLPIADDAWDNGEMQEAPDIKHANIETATHFQRLCLSVTILGKVVDSLQQPGSASELTQVQQINELHLKLNEMCSKWTDQNLVPEAYLLAASATAITYTALFKFFNIHLRAPPSPAADAVRVLMNEGILHMAADGVVKFAKVVESAITSNNFSDRISPFISDALYQAAVQYATYLGHRSDRAMETDFDILQSLLSRVGGRWRSGADFDRFLEAKKLI